MWGSVVQRHTCAQRTHAPAAHSRSRSARQRTHISSVRAVARCCQVALPAPLSAEELKKEKKEKRKEERRRQERRDARRAQAQQPPPAHPARQGHRDADPAENPTVLPLRKADLGHALRDWVFFKEINSIQFASEF